MSVIHYESGVFYAWIDGILTVIPIGSGSGSDPLGLNSPLALDGEDGIDNFYPPIVNQQTQIGPFTAGSVIFSDGVKLTQDNASFFWDNTTKRFGIGTNTPSKKLDIIDQTDYQMTFEGNGDNAGQSHLTLHTAGAASFNSPTFIAKRSRGTIAIPSAIQLGDELFRVGVKGYHSGAAFDLNRRIFQVNAVENWTSTAMGYYLSFLTRLAGTAGGPTERVRITDNGNLDVFGGLQCDSILNDTGLAHGTYTPTITIGTNIISVTGAASNYLRVGNTVLVTGTFTVDPNGAGVPSDLQISLPIASSFTTTAQLSGVCSSPNASGIPESGNLVADVANDTAKLTFDCQFSGSHTMSFVFSYVVV